MKPKILLLDPPAELENTLRAANWNPTIGSSGARQPASKSHDEYQGLSVAVSLPNVEEQEIIVIDLQSPFIAKSETGPEYVTLDGRRLAVRVRHNFVDSRPAIMHEFASTFDRIFQHGGVFVVFAAPRESWEYNGLDAALRSGKQPGARHDNWGLLSVLGRDHISVKRDSGMEVSPTDALHRSLRSLVARSRFECSLGPLGNPDHIVGESLALSKYGADVAMLVTAPAHKGRIYVLPRDINQAAVVSTLLREVLPDVAPDLFPSVITSLWDLGRSYDLQDARVLLDKIDAVRQAAASQERQLTAEVSDIRNRNRFLSDLVFGTGDELVDAVVKALQVVGFKDVRLPDVAARAAGKDLDEDLQIFDSQGVLLVEVKGLGGHPSDDDCLQITKHAARRMREFRRTDIHTAFIVNHQRSRPPLERDFTRLFRDVVVENAQRENQALISTWSLCKLVKGAMRYGWQPAHLTCLFYRPGPVELIPNDFLLSGTIAKVWKQAQVVSIMVSNVVLRPGMTVLLDTAIELRQFTIESMQVERKQVDEAIPGALVGVKGEFELDGIREGQSVYARIE